MEKIIGKIERMLPPEAGEWSEKIYMAAFSVCLVFLGLRNTTLNLPLQFKGSMILLCALMGMVMALQWLTHLRDTRRVAAAALLVFFYCIILAANRYSFNRFNKLTVVILAAAGAMGIHYRKLLRQWVYAIGGVILLTFSSAFLGATENLVYFIGGERLKMRGSMGVIYPTDAATWVLFFLMFSWISFEKLPDWAMIIIAALSLVFTKGYCDSRCCLACTLVFIFVILYRIFEKKIIEDKGMLKPVKKVVDVLVLIAVPLGAFCIYFLSLLYGRGSSIAAKIDDKINDRLKYSWKALKEYGIKVFGSDFEMKGDGGSYVFPGKDYSFLDSSYINILVYFGIIAGILILIMWIYVTVTGIRINDRRLILIMGVIAVHSFEEHHFAEIIYNPITVMALCSFLPERSAERNNEGCGIRGLFTDARFITALTGGVLFIAVSPVLLAIFRTATDILDGKNSLPGLITALVFIIIFLTAAGLCIYSFIKQKTYALIAGVCTMLFITTAASTFINIKRNAYEDRLEADRDAIRLILDNKTYPVYVNDYPYPYITEYEGLSCSIWTDEDMARYKRGTFLSDSGFEAHCAIKRGYMYAKVSPYTGVYTNDRKVIESLTDNKYRVTGYYSGERNIEINNGELKRTTILPGKYEVRAVLEQEGELDQSEKAVLNLINEDKGKVVASGEIRDPEVNGETDVQMIMNLKDGVRELSYEIVSPEDSGLSLKSLYYMRKPDSDTHYFYNDIYQLIREEYYDGEGKRITRKSGESAAEYEYDENRNKTVIRYYGIDYNPVLINGGYAEVRREYDDLRHVIHESFYGTDGRPIALSDWHSSEKRTVDVKGNVLDRKYYGTDGEPVMVKNGYAEVACDYDDNNNVIYQRFFDTEGKPVIVNSGYAAVRREYDKDDHVIKESYYGTDGEPVNGSKGYAEIRRIYDENDNVTDESFYGSDGKLMLTESGYAGIRRSYDPLGRITEESYYGPDGKPTELNMGQAAVHREYDQNGNITDQIYYGSEGKKKIITKGYAEIRKEYNDQGQVVREEYYGEDGKLIALPDGKAAFETEYDRYGKPAIVRFYGMDGEPVIVKSGYAEIHRDYNEQGQITAESYYGIDGKSLALDSGQASDERAYDRNGNMIMRKFYDVSGNRVAIKSGYSKIEKRYNEKRQVIGESYFGTDDEPIALPTGQASDTREIDDKGNILFQRFYDVSGNAVIIKNGYAGIRREYNDKKQVVYEEYYGTEDERILVPNGYAALSREFDEAGNAIVLKFYDLENKPVIRKSGYYELRRQFDDKKRVIREEYFGLNGEPVNNKDGFSLRLTEYGSDGKATKTMYNLDGDKVETE